MRFCTSVRKGAVQKQSEIVLTTFEKFGKTEKDAGISACATSGEWELAVLLLEESSNCKLQSILGKTTKAATFEAKGTWKVLLFPKTNTTWGRGGPFLFWLSRDVQWVEKVEYSR